MQNITNIQVKIKVNPNSKGSDWIVARKPIITVRCRGSQTANTQTIGHNPKLGSDFYLNGSRYIFKFNFENVFKNARNSKKKRTGCRMGLVQLHSKGWNGPRSYIEPT